MLERRISLYENTYLKNKLVTIYVRHQCDLNVKANGQYLLLFPLSIPSLLCEKNGSATRSDLDRCLDGNLCRCTGYRPIIEAAHKFADGGKPAATAAPVDIEVTVLDFHIL